MSSPQLIQNPLIPSTFSGTVDTTNRTIAYQLNLTTFQSAAANLSLTGLSGDANLRVFREPTSAGGQRSLIRESTNKGKLSESILLNEVAQGIYTIEVTLGDNIPSAAYTLNVAVNADADLNNILWRSPSQVMGWKINGATLGAETQYPAQPSNMQIQGIADLNADGEDDLIWRDANDGRTYYWMFKGGEPVAGDRVSQNIIPPDWQIAAVKDLDGDQQADIVWHNANGGQVVIWMLRDGRAVNGSLFTVGGGWNPVAAADMNGDLKADIVFHNPLNGGVAIWQMNGMAVTNAASYGPGTEWRPQFFGDFNGDGKTDIMFRNTFSGTAAFWLMNGVSVDFGWTTPSVTSDWQVEALGNFDGAVNKSNKDLLWRNRNSGDLVVWLMNDTGRGFASGGGFITLSGQNYNRGTGWTIAGVGDFNSDGKEDILYRNETDGSQEILLMNGSAITRRETLKAQAGGWRVQGLMKREVTSDPFEISGRSATGDFFSATAFDLGLLDGTGNYSDRVSPRNADFFKFNLATESNVTLNVAQSGVTLELFQIQQNGSLGSAVSISPEMLLSGGAYVVKVSTANQAVLPYTLNATGRPKVTDVTSAEFSLASNSLTLTPSTTPDGKNTVTAQFRVTNNSSTTLTNLEVGFRLSRDGQISLTPSDELLRIEGATSNIYTLAAPLAAGATSELLTVTLRLPETSAGFWYVDGDYTVGMVVDPNNKLTESNENDNFNVALGRDKAALAIAGTETIELVGTNFTATGLVAAGQRMTASFTLANLGNRAFPDATLLPIRFVLSSDTTIDDNDPLVGVRRAGTTGAFGALLNLFPIDSPTVLREKETRTFQLEFELPDASSSIWSENRPFYLSAWIDPTGNAGLEVDTTNNKLDEANMNDTLNKIYLRLV
ncbi:FG-GAP-like repeat-containing protein [Leptolyngbya sp. AN03gr2]|uniref:FG-GAP-like repeat-containing protein n=1 Tax=unclassified Leptolyngbya TaxID=2650499 RepID=UPI003D31E014